jgi:hypothetical protein
MALYKHLACIIPLEVIEAVLKSHRPPPILLRDLRSVVRKRRTYFKDPYLCQVWYENTLRKLVDYSLLRMKIAINYHRDQERMKYLIDIRTTQ